MESLPDKWPDYLPGPRDHLLALGAIALTYGTLENLFQAVFTDATEMSREQVSALFQRIPNNTRRDLLSDLLAKASLPENLKGEIRYFSSAFLICADNRHALMHSHSGGVVSSYKTDHYGFVFTKYSRSGKTYVCTPTLRELKGISDTMHCYTLFGGWICSDIVRAKARIKRGETGEFLLSPSLDRPPLPTPLKWRSEEEFRAETDRHRPSLA